MCNDKIRKATCCFNGNQYDLLKIVLPVKVFILIFLFNYPEAVYYQDMQNQQDAQKILTGAC